MPNNNPNPSQPNQNSSTPNFAQSGDYNGQINNQPQNSYQNFGQPTFQQPNNPNYNPTPPPQFQPLQPSLSKTIPGYQDQKAKINWKKYLVYFVVTTYSLFSLIWIGVLYLAPDGSKVCNLQNNQPNCYITLPLTKQVNYIQEEYKTQSTKLKSQSDSKNSLNAIIQEDLIFNDKINEKLIKVFKAQDNYELYIGRNIRFINDKPEFSETFNQKELDARLVELKKEKQELNALIDQNYTNKEAIKEKVKQIYNGLGESPTNQFLQ
jgi:hypothetical protein